MPGTPRRDWADPDLIEPGDIVWLDARHLTPTRGRAAHTWPHDAICLFHYSKGVLPDLIVSGTIFQFVCISSITNKNPFNPNTQVVLDDRDPNLGLTRPSVACVDFAPIVEVSVADDQTVLQGARRLTGPVTRRVPASPTLQAILALFNEYWRAAAQGDAGAP